MGQRVAIVLQHINKYPTKFGNPEQTETRVFYNSWGIGRILPSLFLSILNGMFAVTPRERKFAELIKPQGCADITGEFDPSIFELVGFDDPEAVGHIIEESCNNNGGLFVRITESKDCETTIEFAYMLGSDNDGNYDKFCTFNEWKEKNGKDYIDHGFIEYYYHAITYFGAIEKTSDRPRILK